MFFIYCSKSLNKEEIILNNRENDRSFQDIYDEDNHYEEIKQTKINQRRKTNENFEQHSVLLDIKKKEENEKKRKKKETIAAVSKLIVLGSAVGVMVYSAATDKIREEDPDDDNNGENKEEIEELKVKNATNLDVKEKKEESEVDNENKEDDIIRAHEEIEALKDPMAFLNSEENKKK